MKIVENENYGCETVPSCHLTKFTKKHKLANPILVPVRRRGLSGSGEPRQCHTNALLLAYRYGGTVLTGYWSSCEESELKNKVLCSHSVWVTPEGNAVCPTAHNVHHANESIPFVPCFEHDENAVRNFFKSRTPLTVLEDITYCETDWSYQIKLRGEDGNWQMKILNQMNAKTRKSALKNLIKKGLAGSRTTPVRSSLICNPSFRGRIDLDWYFKNGNTNYLHKVFPRGISEYLNAA